MGHFLTAATGKYVNCFTTVWADKAAHVLYHAEHGRVELAAEGDALAHIDDGDLLNSVGYRFVGTDAVFVGVHRKAEDGTDVAAIHEREEGTRVKVTPKMRAYLHARGFHLKPTTTELFIPGRPFIKPSYHDFRRKGIAKKLFGKAIKSTLEGE